MPSSREIRRWSATIDVPLRRLGPGWYRTLDDAYEINYHYTHGMWFVCFPEDDDAPYDSIAGRSPSGFLEWYPTLWEAREAIAHRSA